MSMSQDLFNFAFCCRGVNHQFCHEIAIRILSERAAFPPLHRLARGPAWAGPLQRTKFGRLSNKVGRFDLADDEAA
jgi:hypothetical protein